MKLIFQSPIEKAAQNKLNELHATGKKGIIKYIAHDKIYKVYETSKPEPDESRLPVWARLRLKNLRNTIQELESYRKMHAVLVDKDRDWFTLPNPIGGCGKEVLSLWILSSEQPYRVCTLYKEDMLFIGRATKERYGHRLVEVEVSK